MKLVIAIVIGATAAICIFCMLAWAGISLLSLGLAYSHHYDKSAGDGVGWIIVVCAPVWIPLILIISVVAGIKVGRIADKKISGPNPDNTPFI
ncbi:MAG TPA: hypothetical protein VFT64_10205 [Rickettsiales bacterium]|nr:hypothetical protein [Rickettsiales bacterium]